MQEPMWKLWRLVLRNILKSCVIACAMLRYLLKWNVLCAGKFSFRSLQLLPPCLVQNRKKLNLFLRISVSVKTVCGNLKKKEIAGRAIPIFPVPNADRATQLSASCRMTVPTRPWISLRCVMTARTSTAKCRIAAGMEKPFPVIIADHSCNVL